MFGEEVKVNKIYHTSGVKTKGQSTPMWFALELKHALDGWLPNRVEDGGQGFVYETKPKGNIAQEDDPKVKKLFKDAKEDLDDYTVDLVENPTAKEVLAMKGTKLLMDNGYSGLVYSDYDPRDFQKDLPAIIIFNPKKNSSPFKLIKTATESFKEDLQEKKIAGLVKKAEKTGMPYGILKRYMIVEWVHGKQVIVQVLLHNNGHSLELIHSLLNQKVHGVALIKTSLLRLNRTRLVQTNILNTQKK